jgi:hypothetical protein
MTEFIVPLNVAKLAKQVGFQELCYYYYDAKGNLQEPFEENGSSTDVEFRVDLSDLLDNYNYRRYLTSAPTREKLQKWLRSSYNLFINPNYNHIHNDGTFYVKYGFMKNSCNSIEGFKSYEAAFEKGLEVALKLLINCDV